MDLFVILIISLFVVILFFNKKDITSPAVIFSISFVLSAIVFTFSSTIWGIELSANTQNVILYGIFVFFGGTLLARLLPERKNRSRDIIDIRIKNNGLYIIIFMCLLFPIFRVFDIFLVTGSLNIFGGLGEYRASETSSFFAKLISIIGPICNATMIMMLVIIINNHLEKKKNRKANYIPVICYFVAVAISSARIDVIYMFINLLIIYLNLNLAKNNSGVTFKQLKYVILAIVILGFTFFGLGFLTGKSQQQESMAGNLSIYAGSSFAALDFYLDGFRYNLDNLGKETFIGLSNLYSWLGIKRIAEGGSMEFIPLGEHSTNVYTCFRPLIHDYNYNGMYIVLFVEGFLFQLLYRKMKNEIRHGNVSWMVFYAYLSSYLILSSIAERVFSCLITLTTIMFIGALVFFKRMVRVTYNK